MEKKLTSQTISMIYKFLHLSWAFLQFQQAVSQYNTLCCLQAWLNAHSSKKWFHIGQSRSGDILEGSNKQQPSRTPAFHVRSETGPSFSSVKWTIKEDPQCHQRVEGTFLWIHIYNPAPPGCKFSSGHHQSALPYFSVTKAGFVRPFTVLTAWMRAEWHWHATGHMFLCSVVHNPRSRFDFCSWHVYFHTKPTLPPHPTPICPTASSFINIDSVQ